MLCGSKSEWEESYASAKKHLLHDAEKFSSLEQIYNNPSHFAGWFLRNVEGNLLLNGSVPAEQNHSSVAAHLGAGASWSVVEQVERLLTRNTHTTSKRRLKESSAYVASLKYKSRLQNQAAGDDEEAKKQLSQYAYSDLFLVEFKSSRRLQYLSHEDVIYVWPNGKPQHCEGQVIINSRQRCTCKRRMAFNVQCRHELCIDGKLDLAKYSTRWLNQRSFNASSSAINLILPLALADANSLFTVGEGPKLSLVDDEITSFGDTFGDESPDLDIDDSEELTLSQLAGNVNPKEATLTYQYVAEKATNLVRLAQSDQAQLGSLCNLLDQLASRLRNGNSIAVQAFDTVMPAGKENPGAMPLLGTLKATPNTYTQKRKISRHEYRRALVAKRRNPLLSLVGNKSNDLTHCPPPRTKTKTCSICKCPGHQRGSCPKIHMFKKPPLDMGKDIHSRQDLSSALATYGRYKTLYRSTEDRREISLTLPQHILGVVIHQRFFVTPNTRKMCLECTCLGPTADPHLTFQNYLFTVESMAAYVGKSKSNVVVCELEDDVTEGYEQFGFPSLSQQSQQNFQPGFLSLSQQAQQISQSADTMGYGLMSQSDQMGYGIMRDGMSADI
jgi:hypothetical protein